MFENHNKKLPSLTQVVKNHDLFAKKSLGQNFLLDYNICYKIGGLTGDLTGKTVIEIGCGPGGLTRAILEHGAKKLYAIEYDPRAVKIAEEIQSAWGVKESGMEESEHKLSIIQEDALKVKVHELGTAPRKIIANLPYNISVVLLAEWLKNISSFESLTLMFQKEVAKRIVAQPKSKAYGRVSILCQWLCDVHIPMELKPEVFTPPPKVDSAIVHFIPLSEPRYNADFHKLDTVLRTAFGQRRKMLRQSLKNLNENISHTLESINIKPTARPEELSIEEFCKIANVL